MGAILSRTPLHERHKPLPNRRTYLLRRTGFGPRSQAGILTGSSVDDPRTRALRADLNTICSTKTAVRTCSVRPVGSPRRRDGRSASRVSGSGAAGVVPVWYLRVGTCVVWYSCGTCVALVRYPCGTSAARVRHRYGSQTAVTPAGSRTAAELRVQRCPSQPRDGRSRLAGWPLQSPGSTAGVPRCYGEPPAVCSCRKPVRLQTSGSGPSPNK